MPPKPSTKRSASSRAAALTPAGRSSSPPPSSSGLNVSLGAASASSIRGPTRRSAAAAAAAAQAEAAAAEAAAAAELKEKSKPLRTFVHCGPVTCMCVNHERSDLLCVGTAHGDMAVITSDVADPVLAEEAGGNPEPVSATNIQRNAHRKKITGIVCDARGRFVTCSGDGSIKIWAVDPTVNNVPVCVKTLFPSEFAAELEKPIVSERREKRFEVPEVTAVVASSIHRGGASVAAGDGAAAAAADEDRGSTGGGGGGPSIAIFASYSDGVVRKWLPDTTDKCVQRVRPGEGRVTCLSLLDGELLCCGDDSGVVSAFPGGDIESSEAVQVQWPEPILCVATARINVPPNSLRNPDPPPATIVFAGSSSGTIYGFDVNTGARKCALKHFGNSGASITTAAGIGGDGACNSAAMCLAVGPNCLLSGHDNGYVLLWNVLDWTVAGRFWHQPVEGRSAALTSAVIFRLPDDPVNAAAAADGSAGGEEQSAAAAASLSPPRPAITSGRPGSAATASTLWQDSGPPPKLALVTSTTAGSVHVLTTIVTETVAKLHDAEREAAREIIAKLKAKRAEEKANKRRM